MKIHIIGCSGTGKSYLARFFAEKYDIVELIVLGHISKE